MENVVDSVISWAIITSVVYGAIILIAVKAVAEEAARRREDMEFWTNRR